MNLPNKLTVLRILFIPLFLVLFYMQGIPDNWQLGAFAVFITASLTDLLDGWIARKQGLITDFGVLMDPLADKLLVMSAMVAFVDVGLVHGAVVVVILAREFLVTSIRLLAAGKGRVIAADFWGKVKTVFQMIWIGAGLLHRWLMSCAYIDRWSFFPHELGGILSAAFRVLTWAVLGLTVLSGINYVVKNRALLQDA